ncbi:NAD(P)/FAD-dependent oxidoreductase [Marinobacterium arenosum]|uniref:NAD(P)/FAD-dependent oxidoreductase n=1 Tax=Marinobacterium arenosum TaxID=2862496 RepID=UPI001C967FB0|nr:FAD-dependent oxidoreductase [Marinobacterium arenosum]MBY4676176.1 FAD-binding oxidoreductase [Marinobacterium arenosum]
MNDFDIAVIGGGMLGAAIAYGLQSQGAKTVLLDKGDRDFRAARGNFGLVWVQSKGIEFPEYAAWTRYSTQRWPQFAARLEAQTGLDLGFQQRGGIHFCLSEAELEQRDRDLARLAAGADGQFRYQMLSAAELKKLVPAVGASIPGASYSEHDGHVNPLYLLRALHDAFQQQGGSYRANHGVDSITPLSPGFRLDSTAGSLTCAKVVLAAGLDNHRLAAMVGLQQPVRPQRGQVLVTERLPEPLLHYPSNYLRQTQEGTIQIGDSKEEVGLDDGTSAEVIARLAQRAQRILPRLANYNVVRAWGALRVLTPDGYPVYEQSESCPGAFAFTSHSGVTLAAAHAEALAAQIIAGRLSGDAAAFDCTRFAEESHVHVC